MRIALLVIFAAAALAGCAGSKTTTYAGENIELLRPLPREQWTPESQLILMTKGDLPAEVKFEVLGELRANQAVHGDTTRVYASLAAKARQVGADAVVKVKVKYRAAAFAFAAPSLSGVAVKITDNGGVDIKKLEGEWK
ncbi:hypothetical protein G7048_03735 [Diaphorobacter sp. HDW4B]|uniref:hypothetical protein n=1 Tax=Diaphorobacter sp. HDW4B TaxID=2714925 RepID=UPI00140CC439|nr:hypothetical protein [Diaphorobacter sp. HDW4B]QIL69562.1 hypothetical protein G7048_03735 [Diaphorobacter sp. HDW4B]